MSNELDGYRQTVSKLTRKHDDYTHLMEVFDQRLRNLSRHLDKSNPKVCLPLVSQSMRERVREKGSAGGQWTGSVRSFVNHDTQLTASREIMQMTKLNCSRWIAK